MTRTSLLFKTLRYHWRTNLAVWLGVVAGTAVIAGALVVGDSVRGSLREMTLARLGDVDLALTGPRFIREQLSADLNISRNPRERVAAPAILLQVSLEKRTPGSGAVLARAGRASLIGLDQRAWGLIGDERPPPQQNQVFLSSRLAAKLEAQAGDEVTLLVELPGDVPRDALLGKRDESSVEIQLQVAVVFDENSRPGRFGLLPDQQLPSNAVVSLGLLQERLGLAARTPTRRDARTLPARINSMLVESIGTIAQRHVDSSNTDWPATTAALNRDLSEDWKLEDIHARIVPNENHHYLSLESDRLILDRQTAQAAREVAEKLGCQTSPVLSYIANEISLAGNAAAARTDNSPLYSRYSIVAGLDPELFAVGAKPPFGPFRFESPAVPPAVADGALGDGDIEQPDGTGEIILNDWLAQDVGAKVGDIVRLTYHVVGSHGELPEVERHFKVRGIVALEGVAADRGLIPEVHGITDVDSFDEWDAPFPMKKVTPHDEAYWKAYRATPKAFVTLKTAQHLWQSRYGDLTSLRVAPVAGQALGKSRDTLSQELLKQLQPEQMGLVFQPVKSQGLQAASGTTDFGGLFIGFSFFLILSAMILIGLLFRLGIERRSANVGLLLATGFSQRQVRRLLLGEGVVIVAAGAIAGCLAAVAYAALIVHGLKTWWIGAIGTRFLELFVGWSSLATGLAISIFAALVALWWGIRSLWKISPRALLAGATQPPVRAHEQLHKSRQAFRRAHMLAGLSALATAAVVLKLVPGNEAFAGFSWPTIVFFLVGLNTLAAGLVYLSAWVDSEHGAAVRGAGLAGAARLGARNAARNRSRSVLSAGLIASATFLIVAIAAGHRNPALETPDKASGNGGFTLVGESTIPILYDLNTSAGRSKLGLDDATTAEQLAPLTAAIALRVNPGENASCLNIYQTRQPAILGVPADMIERGGFKFIGGSGNPWKALRQPADDGTIPVFGDMNTLQYSLHVGPGQTLVLHGENGESVKVKVAGMLDSSVFQGVLLMDEGAFQKLFPSRVGYQYFLIEVPAASAKTVAEALESKLPGFDAEPVVDRLASFLAVQNTYLSTFQALGGLGLLLGTIGLATVMLRNVLERRAELALLRAVGFRDCLLAALVLFENALLLGWGLATGSASALLAMLPHLLSTGADLPWRDVAIIIVAVFIAGMAGALVAVRGALRTPVLATLRAE